MSGAPRPRIVVDCGSAEGATLAVRSLRAAGLDASAGRVPGRADDVVAIVVDSARPLDDAAIAGLSSLVVVATASSGHDHLELERAIERGVWVCSAPGYCAGEVADSTLAMLLDLIRGVTAIDRQVRGGRWEETPSLPMRRIAGARLGLVGFGAIGSEVAARALALGMEVWATATRRALPRGVRAAQLDELLAACDAVSLHVPLTADTDGLIGPHELALMPPGALLVNTARGALVDMAALIEALDGHLGGAALDVLPEEPPHIVPCHPRLIVTSHVAWWSAEAATAAHAFAAASVIAALRGDCPPGALETSGEAGSRR